jgi:hypothetical protein
MGVMCKGVGGGGETEQNEHELCKSMTFWGDGVSGSGGLDCVGPSFVYVAHFVFWRDAWIRTQRAAEASRRATNLPILYVHIKKR